MFIHFLQSCRNFKGLFVSHFDQTEAMLQVNVHALVSHLIAVAFGMFKLNAPYLHAYV